MGKIYVVKSISKFRCACVPACLNVCLRLFYILKVNVSFDWLTEIYLIKYMQIFLDSIIFHSTMNAFKSDYSRYDTRVIIKFLYDSHCGTTNIHQQLLNVMGENAPSIQTVRKWVREIEGGRVDLHDEQRDGRPIEATTDANVTRTQQLLEEDNRCTIDELAEQVGVSHGSMYTILTEKLHKSKKCAKWVPHLLSEEQKHMRMQLCRTNLQRHRADQYFLSQIVTGDETWVYSWDPLLKRQSAEWSDVGTPRPKKIMKKQSSTKVMHIVFFDKRGILLNTAIPPGQRVNGEYYKDVLVRRLRPSFVRNRKNQRIVFHHDNAPAHRCQIVQDYLNRQEWDILPHPPYSPDLAPCDFFLFPKIKESIRGQLFSTIEEINNAFNASLRQISSQEISHCFDSLVRRWEKCVELNGDYVE